VVDHDRLREQLATSIAWNQESISMFGRRMLQPRLTAWFGIGMDVNTRYRTSAPSNSWPTELEAMRDALSEHAGVAFNSALANLYRDGHDSVAWHADDEPALGTNPVIASVSLGARRRFILRRREGGQKETFTLGEGDLVVMHGATQRLWVHAVPKQRAVTDSRVNLTFRRYDLTAT
jgi:alkylated DNA repair dioxygenase AlkB